MKFVKLGTFTALAMALSWAERFIPFLPAMPGVKPGLANIILMIVLEFYGIKSALAVNILRSVLAAALYGGAMSLPYSLCGGVFALVSMWLCKKVHGVSFTGVGVCGAFVHNLTQIAVACVIMQSYYILTYLPFLGLTSVLTGIFTGICAEVCIKLLRKHSILS